jgi:ATP-dependent DNA helicase DinG
MRRLLLPDAPALVAGARKAVWLTSDGEVETIDLSEARLRLQRDTLLVCHAKALGRRLNADRFTALDLLELFAFVHPARFVVPTPRGLAEALELPKPDGAEDDALTLIRATRQLLMDLTDPDFEEKSDPVAIAWFMGGGGGGNQGYCWPWASFVLSALGAPNGPPGRRALGAFQVWKTMPEWEEEPPEPPPGRSSPTTPAPSAPPSRPAPIPVRRTSFWRRPGRVLARRWGISPPPACGRRRTGERCGFLRTPATFSIRSMANCTGSTPIRR